MKVRHWSREREINLKTVELLKVEGNWTIEEARKKKKKKLILEITANEIGFEAWICDPPNFG